MKTYIKTWTLIVVLTALSCRSSHPERTKEPTAIKIMSYNIHHANPPSRVGLIEVQAISAVINKEKPDLVAIQEVDVHTKRSGAELSEAEALGS